MRYLGKVRRDGAGREGLFFPKIAFMSRIGGNRTGWGLSLEFRAVWGETGDAGAGGNVAHCTSDTHVTWQMYFLLNPELCKCTCV